MNMHRIGLTFLLVSSLCCTLSQAAVTVSITSPPNNANFKPGDKVSVTATISWDSGDTAPTGYTYQILEVTNNSNVVLD